MREAFDAYEKLRKHRIEVAFEESKSVVSTVSDAGWLGHTIKTYVVPWYLWFTRSYREKHFIEDVTTVSNYPVKSELRAMLLICLPGRHRLLDCLCLTAETIMKSFACKTISLRREGAFG